MYSWSDPIHSITPQTQCKAIEGCGTLVDLKPLSLFQDVFVPITIGDIPHNTMPFVQLPAETSCFQWGREISEKPGEVSEKRAKQCRISRIFFCWRWNLMCGGWGQWWYSRGATKWWGLRLHMCQLTQTAKNIGLHPNASKTEWFLQHLKQPLLIFWRLVARHGTNWSFLKNHCLWK